MRREGSDVGASVRVWSCHPPRLVCGERLEGVPIRSWRLLLVQWRVGGSRLWLPRSVEDGMFDSDCAVEEVSSRSSGTHASVVGVSP